MYTTSEIPYLKLIRQKRSYAMLRREIPNMVIFFVLLQMSASSLRYSLFALLVQAKIVPQMALKVSKNLLNLQHDDELSSG